MGSRRQSSALGVREAFAAHAVDLCGAARGRGRSRAMLRCVSEQTRLVVAAGLVWLDRARVLLQRRPMAATHGGGRFEFPGGKLERFEAPVAALQRELIEEWGPHATQLRVGRVAEVLHHVYSLPGPEVLLLIYHVDGRSWASRWAQEIALEPGAEAKAFALSDLPLADLLAADHEFAARLATGELSMPWTSSG